MDLSTATVRPQPAAHAWRVVLLLWPVAVLNYLDRQMLSTMGLSIKADMDAVARSRPSIVGAFFGVIR